MKQRWEDQHQKLNMVANVQGGNVVYVHVLVPNEHDLPLTNVKNILNKLKG